MKALILPILLKIAVGEKFREFNSENLDRDREARLFSLFSVVQFRNDPCTSTSSIVSPTADFRNGTCFTSTECTDKGGSARGGCAAGFGVCCVFLVNDSGGGTVNENDTYIQNPGFPTAYGETASVTYTVNKVQDDVCFLRLDFETFSIIGPAASTEDAGGVCTDTVSFTTSGSGFDNTNNYPNICGVNTGQHIYLTMGNMASDTATIAFAFDNTATGTRTWDIKVGQIPCFGDFVPREGCFQWHTAISGQIKSFNYDATSIQQHLASQQYDVCIRQADGFCCIEYTVCDTAGNDFTLDNIGTTSIVGSDCVDQATNSRDYIVIPASSASCGNTNPIGGAYCGPFLNTVTAQTMHVPVCSCVPPFALSIRTNAQFVAANEMNGMAVNKGLCLNYKQIAC